jgi:hypothetical protein
MNINIPNYHYEINNNSIDIELYRLKLTNELMKSITRELVNKSNLKFFKLLRKVKKQFAKFFFMILTNRTYNDEFQKNIYLFDPLYNLPTDDEIQSLFDDFKYTLNIDVNIDIKNKFNDIMNKLKNFNNNNIKYDHEYLENKKKYIYKINNYNYELDIKIFNKLEKEYSGDDIHKHILMGLIRYDTLDSGAEQYVVDLKYKKQLKKYGMNFECFGSMFNHYYDNYCSMFYDIEKYFNSKGSFFGISINYGMFMANPPYDNNLLDKMYQHIKKFYKKALFIMSIPKWDDYPLEKIIDNDKLFNERKVKYEYFLNPYTFKMVKIPPYISYLFCGPDIQKCEKIKTLFLQDQEIIGSRIIIKGKRYIHI